MQSYHHPKEHSLGFSARYSKILLMATSFCVVRQLISRPGSSLTWRPTHSTTRHHVLSGDVQLIYRPVMSLLETSNSASRTSSCRRGCRFRESQLKTMKRSDNLLNSRTTDVRELEEVSISCLALKNAPVTNKHVMSAQG